MSLASLFLTFSISLGLPTGLIDSVCYVESHHNIKAVRKQDGQKGKVQVPAYGVCQIHYATAKLMGYKGSKEALMRPEINVYYAAKYLKYQLDRYDNDYAKAVTAYNQGSAHSDGLSPYFKKVMTYYIEHHKSDKSFTDSWDQG